MSWFLGVDVCMTLEQLVEAYGLEWDSFEESLEDMDREAFDALMTRAKHLAVAGSKIENPNLFESVVMSILVEHQRELSHLQEQLAPVDTKTCPRCNRTSPLEDFFKGPTRDEKVGILCGHCREAFSFCQQK
jgi:hypothetical protein